MAHLWEEILGVARRQPAAPALLCGGSTWSYGQLVSEAARVARRLERAGVRPGDRVLSTLPNGPDLVFLLLGTLACGGVYAPLHAAATEREILEAQRELEPKVSVVPRSPTLGTPETFASLSRAPAEPETSREGGGDDAALVLRTSGTSGQPKGVVLSHRALLSNLRSVLASWEWSPRDRLLLVLPCSHLHGLGLGLLGTFLAGGSVVLAPRFEPGEVLPSLEKYECTLFFGVPPLYERLLRLPERPRERRIARALRLWVSGSAPLSPATFRRFSERFGVELLDRYGMSETGFVLSAPLAGPRRPGVVGLPLPGTEVVVADEAEADRGKVREVAVGEVGELLVRGPGLFSGYWGDPEGTRRSFVGGFFRTGDLAFREPDGMVGIVGRRSLDIIKTRAYRVSALEVENALREHPAVVEAAALGLPHPQWGEEVVAVVVPLGRDVTEEELRAHAARILAPYKVPRRVVFLPELPKTGPGKVEKKRLRDLLASLGEGRSA
ncbi:MAG: long-chain-fatty-acid--CoA ligase [Candidatus Binatia bacterium]|nr:MAG: long-chain-fatty-acid--CoA ligase [Candidatus Binatia bacterium]